MVGGGLSRPHRSVSRDATGQAQARARRAVETLQMVQTFSTGLRVMADHTDPIAFFPGDVLARTARGHPEKIALIFKDEAMSFGALDAKVSGLAGHLCA